ncbi:hypothetical protein [Methylocaldum sp.]|uniref:hypothetical protein n=1 Tax=Methylocaldum sp. TaxID=1969727 RepID=UPI002D50022E|nr:hypothetical protein [Methylocaldum sp.]HYE38078.1 hypothetical protein [Methylocaldum sp.]
MKLTLKTLVIASALAANLAASGNAFAFSPSELGDRPWELNFAVVDVLAGAQSARLNLVNVTDRPVQYHVVAVLQDPETGLPRRLFETDGTGFLEPGQSKKQDFHFRPASTLDRRQMRIMVYTGNPDAVNEIGAATPAIAASMTLIDSSTGKTSGIFLPAVQRTIAAP